MRRFLRIAVLLLTGTLGALLLGAGVVVAVVLSRPPLTETASTLHPTIGRAECIECHAPIADEWRRSYHYRSLTGSYWQEARTLGYLSVFERVRKPCRNCHAPANVLDLGVGPPSPGADGDRAGVECTPNLLENPKGTIPAARADDVQLGVDCTSCHVSERGILGAGSGGGAPHATIADPRFRDPAVAAETLCRTCHRSIVDAWRATALATEGTTCLSCHMPEVVAPSVAGGPPRERRSHAFPADKDDAMLRLAVNATLDITPDRTARVRLTNDRVGHDLPSGGNWLSVRIGALDASGREIGRIVKGFGREEPLLLGFWPFNADSRIEYGGAREVDLPLPEGADRVEAVVRYHDWIKTSRAVVTLKADVEPASPRPASIALPAPARPRG